MEVSELPLRKAALVEPRGPRSSNVADSGDVPEHVVHNDGETGNLGGICAGKGSRDSRPSMVCFPDPYSCFFFLNLSTSCFGLADMMMNLFSKDLTEHFKLACEIW